MITETIKLNEMCLFTELFLGLSIMYLTLFSLLVAYNSQYRFPLMQSALINISIMVLLMSCYLLTNENLDTVKFNCFFNSVVFDYLSFFSKFFISFLSAVSLLFIKDYVIAQKINRFEYVIIILLSILGLFLLCSANDFLTVYLGMELQSLSFYLLAAFKKRSSYAVDAGLKYFILGSLSSSLFLFGVSYLYGIFGSINFDDIKKLSIINVMSENQTMIRLDLVQKALNALCDEGILNCTAISSEEIPNNFVSYYFGAYDEAMAILQNMLPFFGKDYYDDCLIDYMLSGESNAVLVKYFEPKLGLFFVLNSSEFSYGVTASLLFVFFSLFFKLSLAPFHLWSPDVYENSPSSSSFFFAVVPKIAIFVVLIRLSYNSIYFSFNWLKEILALITLLSVLGGSLGGLYQRQIKSLLAYSSISHMGYVMLAFSSDSFLGLEMLFFYLIIYSMSGLCIWSIFILTRLKKTDHIKQNKNLADFVLLYKSNYMLALFFMSSLFSIAGIPPMIGFIAKMNVFSVAIENNFYVVATLSVLFSVISTFFYLRMIKVMYFEQVLVGRLYYPITSTKIIIIVILFYLIFLLFINPTLLYLLCHKIVLEAFIPVLPSPGNSTIFDVALETAINSSREAKILNDEIIAKEQAEALLQQRIAKEQAEALLAQAAKDIKEKADCEEMGKIIKSAQENYSRSSDISDSVNTEAPEEVAEVKKGPKKRVINIRRYKNK